ncbi:nitrate reductase [Drepanopeziza brunnea f. sp. 'multigermtubi' MB_m1]|uniref:Nitrate reductase n=1 Tax=Marssonina brunnea f. sp. multigermtubi (strain MB_m1) TaxID=1072389 RepID=K1W780_MARBU|nr:nitrate reductase [Drepanopeziza brunnea f. sp. 'multigermtubi' MB_m1]EKD12915.1 nitrate reductase [Drepanopeziza brunnea f. sp. 'multigermtubi' MB_m1]
MYVWTRARSSAIADDGSACQDGHLSASPLRLLWCFHFLWCVLLARLEKLYMFWPRTVNMIVSRPESLGMVTSETSETGESGRQADCLSDSGDKKKKKKKKKTEPSIWQCRLILRVERRANVLDCMPIGEEIESRDPPGDISSQRNEKFAIYGKEDTFSKVSLLLRSSGIKPGYALIMHILADKDDLTQLRVIVGTETSVRSETSNFGKPLKLGSLELRKPDSPPIRPGESGGQARNNVIANYDSTWLEPTKCGGALVRAPSYDLKGCFACLEDWGDKEERTVLDDR